MEAKKKGLIDCRQLHEQLDLRVLSIQPVIANGQIFSCFGRLLADWRMLGSCVLVDGKLTMAKNVVVPPPNFRGDLLAFEVVNYKEWQPASRVRHFLNRQFSYSVCHAARICRWRYNGQRPTMKTFGK